MYNEHFGFSESPFNVTPDSRFFFVNPCYEEAFATVRYGIDARKGFVVVSGEAGTGKTTVLKRLLNSLDPHVHTACIFDPHLSFVELLRGTLIALGQTPIAEDRLAMMGQLYDYLIEQLEAGQIVALIIDEAQNVSIEMLEELRLLSNIETDTDKLIQIILCGQPGFEERLERPELVQLKQRVALRCRLYPLEKSEVGSYIDSRLKTVRFHRRDLFDGECVDRIARYSKGIPRLINVICDNALLVAYSAGRRWVSTDDINQAAKELHLAEIVEQPVKPPPQVAPLPPLEEVFRPTWQKPVRKEPPRPEFESVFTDTDRQRGGFWDSPRESRSRGLGALLILLMMGGILAYVATQQQPLTLAVLGNYLARWTSMIQEYRATEPPVLPTPAATQPEVTPPPETAPVVVPEEPGKLIETLNDDLMIGDDLAKVPNTETTVPQEKKAPVKTPAPARNQRATVERRPPEGSSDGTYSIGRMEVDVYKAIRDRAITGVHVVSINDGTVYLEGRVATTRQKLAAVRAALSVPGVRNVEDRIVIR